MAHKNFIFGNEIWVIERNEDGSVEEYTGYMFLAVSGKAVIVSSFIDDRDYEEVLDFHIKRTAENYDTPLSVFPVDDCFTNKEECERVYKELLEH